jgi:hypothetical protein
VICDWSFVLEITNHQSQITNELSNPWPISRLT